jgi:hypothetical protein
MPPADIIPLNGPQRLHFEVILASLEKALSRLELIAQGREHGGCRLTRMDGDLPDAFWEGAAPIVERLRAKVASLATAMALTERHTSSKRLVRTLLTAQLLKIEDSSSSRLRGYGAVDPAVEGRLDPALEALQLDLHAVLDLLSSGVERRA